MDPYRAIFDVLEQAVAGGVTPGCVGLVWRAGSLEYHEAHGVLATSPRSSVCDVPVQRDTRYDLASLTKVLATTTLAAVAVGEGKVCLDDEVPAPFGSGYPGVTLRHILAHEGGFEAHREFFARDGLRDREAVLRAVAAEPRRAAPGIEGVYSDLGFMALGAWLEYLGGARLDRLFMRTFAPFIRNETDTVPDLAFRPVSDGALSWEDERRVAPTEVYEPERPGAHSHEALRHASHVMAHGVVHDDNAFVMGGVAGHAGLFGSAEGVLEIALGWLEHRIPGVDPAVRDAFWSWSSRLGSPRKLGWDGVSADGTGSTGESIHPASVGHLGFTGCSLWIDPLDPAIYILLSNRVHPRRDGLEGIRALRRKFHKAAAAPRRSFER
ncbi:MAG: serine hydrolase domain-containing protein [Nannocystaceae bacterium]